LTVMSAEAKAGRNSPEEGRHATTEHIAVADMQRARYALVEMLRLSA